jgi:hypothetical protein
MGGNWDEPEKNNEKTMGNQNGRTWKSLAGRN